MNDWKVQARIAAALHYWMAKNNLTTSEVSRKLGIAYAKLSRLEKELDYPNLAELIAIADALNTSTDFLLCRDERRKVDDKCSQNSCCDPDP